MSSGRIVKSGGKELALELEAYGYADYREIEAADMAELTLMRTPTETALVQAFDAAKATLPGDVDRAPRLSKLFNRNGLPHRRVEDFKYTDLRALMREVAPFRRSLRPRKPRRRFRTLWLLRPRRASGPVRRRPSGA